MAAESSIAWTSSAATAIERIVASESTTTYVYDVAEQVGFGASVESGVKDTDSSGSVVKLETRAGAGLGLVGRLTEGTSFETIRGSILTALTTPIGLAAMAQSLTYLPPSSPSAKLVIQVAGVASSGTDLTLTSSLASLSTSWSVLPSDIAILLSATPQEAVDLASIGYQINSHSVHIFDYFGSAREVSTKLQIPSSVSGADVASALTSAGYTPFEYWGPSDATSVVVILNGALAHTLKAVISNIPTVGILVVRLLRPWSDEQFKNTIPSSASELHVFDDVPIDTSTGNLYIEVLSALAGNAKAPLIRAQRVTAAKIQEYLSHPLALDTLVKSFAGIKDSTPRKAPLFASVKKTVFFNTAESASVPVTELVRNTLSAAPDVSIRYLKENDTLSSSLDISADRIALSPNGDASQNVSLHSVIPFTDATTDFLGILDQKVIQSHGVLKYAKEGSEVFVVSQQDSTEFLAGLHKETYEILANRNIRVYLFNPSQSKLSSSKDEVVNALILSAFLRLYIGKQATPKVVASVAALSLESSIESVSLEDIVNDSWSLLRQVEIPKTLPQELEEKQAASLKVFDFNTISAATPLTQAAETDAPKIGSWHDAAKHLLFPGAFQASSDEQSSSDEYPSLPSLRPDVPERTYLATCTVNRRLTPLDYDRNVFHLEFSTKGTGLKYEIGEALGVHGWNDEQEVLDFCKWYDVDPSHIITIPVIAGSETFHSRTVFQILQQQVDLFGKPTKSFFSELAEHATDSIEHKALRFIGAAEGSYMLKKLSEKDMVNFVDVLQAYPSARPPIEVLCELIGDIKPRHYSIASAQAVVGDQVDLLVVSVDWTGPKGSPRFGQCTRYLAGLKIGQKVTVSIKPSVMKLPPHTTQPIIMAGLGTGAAPFRAFLQYTAWLADQGIPTGPVYYYFGSRYRSQEYLYGEEIEAYIMNKTITKAGLAFSRDSKRKVYIQHLMLEDANDLAKMLKSQNGVFYLCGPTWPVPDVYEALVGALVKNEGFTPESAGAYLESLKEDERYVLEVY